MAQKEQAALRAEIDTTLASGGGDKITGAEIRGFFRDLLDSVRWYDATSGEVSSVNGSSGAVVLDFADVGALADTFSADLVDTAAGKGAALVGYHNDIGTKFGGATSLQAVLDYIAEWGLFQQEAEDAVEVDALSADDGIGLVLGDGRFGHIAPGLLLGTSVNSVVESTAANYGVTTATPALVINKAPGDAVATLPLQSAQEFVAGVKYEFLHQGGGTFKVVCGDASIAVNEASNGEASVNRGDKAVVQNLGPNKWSVVTFGVATTADTTPPTIVSVSPAPGSTILPGTPITVTFSEGVQPGTGLITQRQSTGGGAYADDGTIDVTAPAGKMSISGNVMTLQPATAHVEGDAYAYRIAAGALTDLASPPNAFAGVAADNVIGPFTIAESSVSGIEVVDSGSFFLSPGPTTPGTETHTLNAMPQTGDMVIAFQVWGSQINALPAGFSAILDRTNKASPGWYAAQRTEGGTPSDQIAYPRVYFHRQAAGYLTLRGNGTLAISGAALKTKSIATEPADAPAYAQLVDNELRVAVFAIDTMDLTPSVAALEAAGWVVRINQNTEQGSSSSGCTLVVATKAQGGSATDSIDPPPLDSGNVVYEALQFGVKVV